jgi:hypothetical protein
MATVNKTATRLVAATNKTRTVGYNNGPAASRAAGPAATVARWAGKTLSGPTARHG